MLAFDELAAALAYCGFNVRRWKGERLYLSGYGRDISAYLETAAPPGPAPADGYRLVVTSSWRAPRHNGLRCKGVKHALLCDLFAAGLIGAPPPPSWQDVILDAPQSERPAIRRYAAKAAALQDVTRAESPTLRSLPARRQRDPYAELRALHRTSSRD